MKTIIGLSGFAGSGKGTVSDYLETHHGAIAMSFAATMKDVTALLFGWDRDMVEGSTPQSRAWREQRDAYWSDVFGRDITPRHMLQYIGTNVFRDHLHQDIWVQIVLNKIRMTPEDSFIVVNDVRFVNERTALRKIGAQFCRIERNDWPSTEHSDIWMAGLTGTLHSGDYVPPTLHPSEWDWVKDATEPAHRNMDYYLKNSGSFEELYQQIDCLVALL